MTIKEHLENKVNDYIARQIWAKVSTELDAKIPTGELADEHVRFPWMMKRALELMEEYKPVDKPAKKKPVPKKEPVKEKHEEKAEDSMGDSGSDPA